MPQNARWRASDSITAAVLFLATAGFTLWQNMRVAVLWDLSYLLDSAWRFSLGQLPFRDIPFAHAPLTFLVHAVLVSLLGRVYWPHIAWAILESGLATVLTWRILRALARDRTWGAGTRLWPVILTLPLVFLGIYGIYPHPIYDSDAALSVLIALYLLQKAERSGSRNVSFVAGAECVLPLFFKQNIGLAFLAAVVLYVAISAWSAWKRKESLASAAWLAAGILAALIGAISTIQLTVGLRSYYYWTVTFASERRLPGLGILMSTYHQQSLLWTIPAAIAGVALIRWTKWPRPVTDLLATLLLSAPFLWTLLSLTLTSDADDRADQLLGLWPHLLILGAMVAVANLRPVVLRHRHLFPALLPLILLATIDGTFLSQQLWGSTYAMWPLLVLLLWSMLEHVPDVSRPLALIVSATLLVCGSLYAIGLERLSYIHLDGALQRATLPELRGMATAGPWIPQFEELVGVTNSEIPRGDGILMIPGEVPFFFTTGRTPAFPILLFDPATDPYSPQQTLEQARSHNIRWLIVSRNPQLAGPPHPDLDEITRAVEQDFELKRTTAGYDIFRRKEGTNARGN